jgi:hypothetical protein
MNIGDKVVTYSSLGVIVGVSTDGLPVVEWAEGTWMAHSADELIVMPVLEPAEDLDPSKDTE